MALIGEMQYLTIGSNTYKIFNMTYRAGIGFLNNIVITTV